MARTDVRRQLEDVAERLRQLRLELRVAEEQLRVLDDGAEDARLRALVSETPLAQHEHRDSQRHADAMRHHREEVLSTIARLEQSSDDLLDRLAQRR